MLTLVSVVTPVAIPIYSIIIGNTLYAVFPFLWPIYSMIWNLFLFIPFSDFTHPLPVVIYGNQQSVVSNLGV